MSSINAMSIIKPINVKLQCRSYDIYNEVKDEIEELRTLRGSYSMLNFWYIQAESLARKVLLISSIVITLSIVWLSNVIIEN